MNDKDVWQPDSGLAYAVETTFTEDSTRVQTGVDNFTPMFTIEQLEYKATHIPVAESAKIMQIVAKGYPFKLHYFSVYRGVWTDGTFRVGKSNSISIGSLEEGGEYLDTFSFNMTGKNPI